MQFQKKATGGPYNSLMKLIIRILIFFIIIFLLVVLVDKINFPYPNKKIEKIIPNANFKVLK
tara:strand:- start:496 stop:681 length:186 start_codon:yes stop_codon:yes gene_type:complete